LNGQEVRVQIELTDDEALVLFDLLFDYGSQDDGRQLVIRNAAERNALWRLHGALERRLVQPFEKDYADQLSAARARLEDGGGSW
jgi:hypothetical protein